MNITLVQQDVVKADKAANFRTTRRLVERVVKQEARPGLIVLPELWSTGYALQDLATLASENGDDEAEFLGEIARAYGVWFAGGSVAAKTVDGIVNRAQVINTKGELVTQYDKIHLVPMFHEDRYLIGGTKICKYEIESRHIGLAICYDLRFCELLHNLRLSGAEILIISGQWPMKRITHWQILLRARAIENQCFVIGVNAAGTRDGHGGNSMAVAPDGRILTELGVEESYATVSLDLDEVAEVRKAIPVVDGRKPDLYRNMG
ncbi:carbon-nitrogen family hydrolase [Desulfopila sp. IMCC35008]|uniref:carbon-nitrogen family hydrolase n=1 Tax=Desulfopila sp. IMCC35008 TaxID=2653858 RepID=UPI0013D71A5D|nr:carbon-nitrogen family hydrolase [Desulfopila sp. IMCC35008]